MNATSAPIDMRRTRALLDRLDPTWRSRCDIEGCHHHRRARLHNERDVASAPRRAHADVIRSRAA